MKKVTALLLAACFALPAIAHDCDCDCENGHGRKSAGETPVTETPAKANDARVSAPASEETGKSAEDRAVKEGVEEDKNALQKFLDHPPASDAAKKRMKKK